MLSLTKLLIIAVIIFAVFGAGKLPKVMGDLGKGLRALKDGVNGEDFEAAEERRRQEAAQQARLREISTLEAERAAPPTIDHEPRA